MKRAVFFLNAALFFLFSPLKAISPQQELRRLALINEAEKRLIYQDTYFLKLLYYEKNLFGHIKSRNNNPDFFLSKWGRINPNLEIKSLINGLFYEGGENNPQCAFPLRYVWFRKKLNIDEKEFPRPYCSDYEDWARQINPASINLVFAAGYLNNPSTLYGHTFLLLKKEKDTNASLLDYTVNYAAATGEEKGLFFALKGLFGLYNGNFTTMPYYLKIQEYVNMENRDLWEYPLSFSKEEKENLLMHLWELGKSSFPYYFFNKNCSWQLIPLIEIAKPDLKLKEKSGLWVIPSDTAKLIVSKAGTGDFEWRPSLVNKLKRKFSLLDEEEKKAFNELKKGKLNIILENKSMARIYEVYSDFLELEFQRGKIKKNEFDLKIDPILSHRASLGPQNTFENEQKPSISPIDGHESFKIYSGKIFSKKRDYYELGIRPAFCDLLDDNAGYIKNSQLKMGDLKLRYDAKNNKLFIKELALTEINSINPISPVDESLSWEVFLGWREFERNRYPENQGIFSLKGGPGLAMERAKLSSVFFAISDMEIRVGNPLKKGWAIGAGPKAGYKFSQKKFEMLFSSGFMSFISGKEKPVLESKLEMAYNINKNLAIRVTGSISAGEEESGIYIHKFFSPL